MKTKCRYNNGGACCILSQNIRGSGKKAKKIYLALLGKKIGDINKGQCLDRIRDNQITTREQVRLRKGQ